jgi:hypothetical protein
MSRKSRQMTSFFPTGNFNQAAIERAMKSDAPPDGASKTFTWAGDAGANNGDIIWRDLHSARTTIHIASGMTLEVKQQGRYRLVFDAHFLVKHAALAHKFDAFNALHQHLFTLVTSPQVVHTPLYTVSQPCVVRGTFNEIERQGDLDAIKYLIRRGAGEYKD